MKIILTVGQWGCYILGCVMAAIIILATMLAGLLAEGISLFKWKKSKV